MQEKDIAGIEGSVGVTLPDHYRRFLTEHAESIRAAKKKLPMRALLYFDLKKIIAINKGLHDNHWMIEINEDSEPWPLDHFVVGTDGGGDFWVVDLNDPKEAILKYDSEAGGRIGPSEYRSWAEYMAGVERDLQNPEKWRKGDEEPAAWPPCGGGGWTRTQGPSLIRVWIDPEPVENPAGRAPIRSSTSGLGLSSDISRPGTWTAALRSAAITRGTFPSRTRLASTLSGTSRTECGPFSIPACSHVNSVSGRIKVPL